MDLPFENAKILIVDDEVRNVNLLHQVLDHAGYSHLHTTTDPREVCDLHEKIRPDLILLDIKMPFMDGFEVMKQLEQAKGDSYLPILILTAEVDDRTRLHALDSGGKDFMEKPINIPELLLRVKNLLEIKLLHEQVREQNAKLEAIVSERTQELQSTNDELVAFNFTASHDFQEPLRKIILFGDRLQIEMDDKLSDKGKHYIDRMRVSAMRLHCLITDLLNYSKMEYYKSNMIELDLKNIIAEVVCDLELQIKETDGTVNMGQMPTLEGSGPKMRQLFQNLISNGLKYCKAGEPPVISINSREIDSATWEISVEDNGIGFDEKYSSLIFKPFKQLHEKNRYEGTGMGLFICAKIVSLHGGKIAVTSKINGGTKFVITLPQKQALEESA